MPMSIPWAVRSGITLANDLEKAPELRSMVPPSTLSLSRACWDKYTLPSPPTATTSVGFVPTARNTQPGASFSHPKGRRNVTTHLLHKHVTQHECSCGAKTGYGSNCATCNTAANDSPRCATSKPWLVGERICTKHSVASVEPDREPAGVPARCRQSQLPQEGSTGGSITGTNRPGQASTEPSAGMVPWLVRPSIQIGYLQ